MDSLDQYISLFREHKAQICAHAPQLLNACRDEALRRLADLRAPKKGDEGYPAISIDQILAPDYGININRVDFQADPADSFRCGVPNVSTALAIVVNDTFHSTPAIERNLPPGVQVMSLAKAAAEFPEIVEARYNRLASPGSAVAQLNALFAQDGVFIRISKGVRLDKPIQIVNIFNASQPFMAVRRVLVVVEEDAAAQILLCDHSVADDVQYLANQVGEIYLQRGAQLDFYELEESSPLTSRLAELYVRQEADSAITVNGTTLRGGATRNMYCIDQQGEHASAKLAGMAIASGAQIIDNATRVLHNCPKCDSNQMFKYILDDSAVGSFFGTIVVDEKAKFTNAYQSNRNILASTDAKMHTRPQLEIYCDEVKCSHGATVGQLDPNALFYMRQRGIPEHQAKMMLMQAFMADVIDTVQIPALKSRLQQLVERRLAGEHELCAACQAARVPDDLQ